MMTPKMVPGGARTKKIMIVVFSKATLVQLALRDEILFDLLWEEAY